MRKKRNPTQYGAHTHEDPVTHEIVTEVRDQFWWARKRCVDTVDRELLGLPFGDHQRLVREVIAMLTAKLPRTEAA